MDGFDDAQRLRNQQKAADVAATQDPGRVARGAPALVLRTTTVSSYPTSAAAFFACNIVTVLGAEVEGGAGTTTPGTDVIYALNIGSAIPPAGTQVLATFVDSRWSFRHDG